MARPTPLLSTSNQGGRAVGGARAVPRGFRLVLAALALPLLLGCGLADYEARMSSEKTRLERFDLEAQYLEGPVETPEKKKKEGARGPDFADVFFRPPRGITTRPDDKHAYGELYYRYARRPNTNSPVLEVALAAYRDGKDQYVKDLLLPFPGVSAVAGTRRPRERLWRDPLVIETRTVDDVSFNFYQRGDYRAAVVFRIDKNRAGGELNRMLDLSLSTLEVGPEAAKARRAYLQQVRAASGLAKPEK